MSTDVPSGQGVEGDEPTIGIANEYAYVRCQRVVTPAGERLAIDAPKSGHRILLDAVELEAIAWQTKESLSRLLAGGTGPESHGVEEEGQ